MLSIPSFLFDVLTPEQKELLADRQSQQVEESAALMRNGAGLLVNCKTEELVETAQLLRTTIDNFLRAHAAPTATTATTAVKTDRSYDRCWYYTMAHRPAELTHLTYKHIKNDPRIVAIWAEAKALDAEGRLTPGGKVK